MAAKVFANTSSLSTNWDVNVKKNWIDSYGARIASQGILYACGKDVSAP